mmetsp:Transcript_115959/g.334857  ORF Transcript_115959/g.334857 Transcript_115959/m.334857 type:complete len:889 (+) Transcript_115959:108-2774(+)|eukprot:CAMPEP_0176167512 /NCGR_PEP_ID=MMETSP0120_2-20121206/85706_1 /TAXON_ID=160619 /ORGANISM="Kryptoperidinium foliaceum, Strain CCMP 1326" /LENGTH=888 /DNA_ID=CAMNT_0017505145 /DNA_START=53 /DNA_END=2719 /DNA_ORIENTATION=+
MAPTTDNNPQAGQGRPLPKKEADIFKNVVKHYEMKQYKKALKQADSILKKFPNHGETLAMKGLVLNNMGKKEDAHALVKQGLMNDMRSHVCWHVYGLLHRADRNYNEAIKAYKQALRIDSDNLQILRDLSMLQVQMRDLAGFAVTRHNILNHKPNGKINWLAFALAKHLNGDLRGAISVIDIYLSTLSDGAPELSRGFEASELALYRNRILSEIPNNLEEALEHLSTCKKLVVDRTAWLMTKAKYELFLGRFSEARQTILDMFDRGLTEDYCVHSMYMCSLLEMEAPICEEVLKLPGTRTLASMIPLTSEQREKLLEAYKIELFPKYSRSLAMQRIPMNLVNGDRLKNSLDVFMRKQLVKGVPSLCRELSTFFLVEQNGRYAIATDPFFVKSHPTYKLIVEMVDGYVSSLKENKKLLPTDEFEEPPSTELWAWYLRAGLHELVAEYKEGIILLDQCLDHTPTAVDVYELKARLLKSSGDLKTAVECLDKGRDLDRQDRYINNQTTKYMLEAGMESDALERISLFTKHEGNPEANLYDMQCSWYELGLGACLARKEKWGPGLKKYSAVVKHFDDFQEDQFDFHHYCVRKVTLRAYTDVLRFEDEIWGEDYYFTAAQGMIHIYLHISDNPSVLEADKEPDYSKMTAAEKKKAKAIARKKRLQAEKKAAEKKADGSANGGTKKGKKSPVDEDPEGKELLKLDPLTEASKYSSILSKHCPKRLGTWALQYDVAIRRKKWLLALQSLYQMSHLAPLDSGYFSRLVDFAHKLPGMKCASDAATAVLSLEFPKLLKGSSIKEFVSGALSAIRCGEIVEFSYRVAVAEAAMQAGLEPADKAGALVVDGGLDMPGVNVKSCTAALKCLHEFGPSAKPAADKLKAMVLERFPALEDKL